jgi:hypothetical protein
MQEMGLALGVALLLSILIGAWIILSIPVYISARLMTMKRVSFPKAMLATLVAPLLYAIIAVGSLLLMDSIGVIAIVLALIAAPMAWLWAYKNLFDTGWLRALGITILSVVLLVVSIWMVSSMMSIILPDLPLHDISPMPLPPLQNV